MNYLHTYTSPLGIITAASDGISITGLWLEGQKYFASTLGQKAIEAELPIFDQLGRWLMLYFSGKQPDFTPPLAPEGTGYQKAVWEELLEIPYGTTLSYSDVKHRMEAKGMGKTSARAVGGAVGHNPISILIPCHRVLGKDGSLTGYAGGTDKKVFLLELEKASFLSRP